MLEKDSPEVMAASSRRVKIIELQDMDIKRFIMSGCCLSLFIRGSIYPTNLVKTRLQVQTRNSYYNGTWDAFRKIFRYEGIRGFYKGFFVSIFGIVGEQSYILTYEMTRRACGDLDNTVRSFIAGGTASLVSQTIRVPLDVITQKLMLLGQTADGKTSIRKVGIQDMVKIMQEIHGRHGLGGFYRGYLAALLTNVPNSALFWPFYHFYSENLASLLNSTANTFPPLIVVQACAGPMAGCTAAILTNPMDIIRTRLQVTGGRSITRTFSKLMQEEGAKGLTKGLTARVLSTIPNSFVMMVGYETIKKFSAHQL
ncbi:putative solute carrier family 25 member 44 [Apostichopus japonicus]|uniref:Putative solute carrier family 25 member 44 n=2 Tax=Stichopus japonicus TaxID=307972 RepID=A0A2G8KDR8_STIJA|nr:putative solute carrier family 25 member 44 [Apostichopus japonicus]